jgi:hypothetical protein
MYKTDVPNPRLLVVQPSPELNIPSGHRSMKIENYYYVLFMLWQIDKLPWQRTELIRRHMRVAICGYYRKEIAEMGLLSYFLHL